MIVSKGRLGAALLCLLVFGAGSTSWAARCATGRHETRENRFTPLPPAGRTLSRVAAPVATTANPPYVTEHFRVLWGNGYSAQDTPWQDPDGDGIPAWVEVLGAALEGAYDAQTGLGFPEPYGVDSCTADPLGGCYIDAYVGNTGVVVDGQRIAIGSSFYAYTEIDTDFDVAFFVFNFSSIGSEGVLRATAAHELFHAVQRAMGYPWDDESNETGIDGERWIREGWFLEASATWVEEVTFPQVDDYVTYVDGFLAQPQAALSSLDGLHEYGAALFAGYLWELYGGAGLVREVYEDAYGLELEPALRAALGDRDAGQLEDVVAAFWAQAAAPSTAIWPDADQFQVAAPLSTVTSTPTTVAPTVATRPGRFGANVIRVAAATLPAAVGMAWDDPAAWRLATRSGPGALVVVANPALAPAVEIGRVDGGGPATLAVVNASPGDGARHYTLVIGGEGAGDEAPGGGGGGGCFLHSLGR